MSGTRLEVEIVPSEGSYWRREREGRSWYYFGPRGDAANSQLLTQAEWDAYQNQYERDDEGRRVSGGGRPDGPPLAPEEAGYLLPAESDLSTLDQLERVAYSAGLWGEGILKGTILVMPAILLLAMAVGLTMGIIRVGVRGTEKFLPVRRRCD